MKTEWLGKRRGSRREFEIFEKPQRAQLTFPSGSVVKKKKSCLPMQEMWVPWVGKIPWRRK